MTGRLVVPILCAALLGSCSDQKREDELLKQASLAQEQQRALEHTLADRDQYLADVMRTVNEVYADLEQARVKEAGIVARSGGAEGPLQIANAGTRQRLLQNIGDIGTALKDNRKKIAELQTRMKSFRGEMAGLNTLVKTLKQSLQEREESIAQLEARVKGLETTVTEKEKVIAERDTRLDEQQRKLNTAYYIVGSRKELREKGIITDEGGFLWGLLGSTTVLASGVDPTQFRPIDKTGDQTISVSGDIEEILPHRNQDLFVTAGPMEEQRGSTLTIVRPEQFWQEDYLVIVVD